MKIQTISYLMNKYSPLWCVFH